MGVQITESTRLRSVSQISNDTLDPLSDSVRRNVKFIPKEDIIDVVIVELVLSYKVVSCVMFRRIKSRSLITAEKILSQESIGALMMKRNYVELIPAFAPGKIQMSYNECQIMLNNITDSLGT